MEGETSFQKQSPIGCRSESKKRGSMEIEEKCETSQKRVKIRDLESVFLSEGRGGSDAANQDSSALDLNVDAGSANCKVADDDAACVDESINLPVSEKEDKEHNDRLTKVRGFDLDLNAADVSSCINESFYRVKVHQHVRSRDDSDCVSSVGPMVEKDPMRVWKGLKQNNYLSSHYGAPPASMPKARGRKKSSNSDVMKKKIELAKKEQVDRFARVAAPSGLLNGLNPGIINHVRNSKQVHSIIEALVKSERNKNLIYDRKEAVIHGEARLGRRQMSGHAFSSKSVYPNTEFARDGDLRMGYPSTHQKMPPRFENENKDDRLPLKLSSSAPVGTENASCLSSDDSANISSVNSLSLKAANIAFQWLELLNQDIKGRLTALRRSKKRVRAVINSELPHVMSREFSSNLYKDVQMTNSTAYLFDQATADSHIVKWNSLFAQMDGALSEEESHLEKWLNQVKEMQLHCEMGLNTVSLHHHPLEQTVTPGNDSRSGAGENLDKDLAVRAAAASIYSTCNFLLSRENLPCFELS